MTVRGKRAPDGRGKKKKKKRNEVRWKYRCAAPAEFSLAWLVCAICWFLSECNSSQTKPADSGISRNNEHFLCRCSVSVSKQRRRDAAMCSSSLSHDVLLGLSPDLHWSGPATFWNIQGVEPHMKWHSLSVRGRIRCVLDHYCTANNSPWQRALAVTWGFYTNAFKNFDTRSLWKWAAATLNIISLARKEWEKSTGIWIVWFMIISNSQYYWKNEILIHPFSWPIFISTVSLLSIKVHSHTHT